MMFRNAYHRSFLVLVLVLAVITTTKTTIAAEESTATVDTVTADTTAPTCGQCLPIGPLMNAFDGLYLVTRLWTITDPTTTSDLDVIQEFATGFASILQAMPGFIQYTAAQTGNSSTVFFQNLFDTEAHASAAQQAATDFVSTNAVLQDGAILPYYFTEDVIAYDDTNGVDCVNTSNEGKYLGTRLYERAAGDVDANVTTAEFTSMVTSSNTTKAILNIPGIVNFMASVSNDETQVFLSNVFDTEEGALDANEVGSQAAASSTMTELAVTSGKIAFDYLCTTTPTTAETTTTTTSSGSSIIIRFFSPITSLMILILSFHHQW